MFAEYLILSISFFLANTTGGMDLFLSSGVQYTLQLILAIGTVFVFKDIILICFLFISIKMIKIQTTKKNLIVMFIYKKCEVCYSIRMKRFFFFVYREGVHFFFFEFPFSFCCCISVEVAFCQCC